VTPAEELLVDSCRAMLVAQMALVAATYTRNAALAGMFQESGVARSRVHERVRSVLESAEMNEEQIASLGLSNANVRRVLKDVSRT
jgi:uncharacterized protein YjiS (DUF1127 family)